MNRRTFTLSSMSVFTGVLFISSKRQPSLSTNINLVNDNKIFKLNKNFNEEELSINISFNKFEIIKNNIFSEKDITVSIYAGSKNNLNKSYSKSIKLSKEDNSEDVASKIGVVDITKNESKVAEELSMVNVDDDLKEIYIEIHIESDFMNDLIFEEKINVDIVDIAEDIETDILLNNQSGKLTVYEDINDNGIADNSQEIILENGINNYELSNIEGSNNNKYWIELILESNTNSKSPTINSINLDGINEWSIEEDWNINEKNNINILPDSLELSNYESDNFSTQKNHTTEQGGWKYDEENEIWTSTEDRHNTLYFDRFENIKNVDFTVRCRSSQEYSSPAWRGNGDEFYYVHVANDEIRKQDDGSATTISSNNKFSADPNEWLDIRIKHIDDTINVWVDDELYFEDVKENALKDGDIGLRAWNSGGEFSKLTVNNIKKHQGNLETEKI